MMISSFTIGPLTVHFYGIIVMLGVLGAAWVAAREAQRRGDDPEVIWDVLVWAVVGGVLGARIWHILTPPQSMVEQGLTTMYYLTHPLDALAVWKGGLGIPGAVIGGALALYIYARRHDLNFTHWVDIIAPGLALGQAIGRWGNFFNQELYGSPCNQPWCLYIEPQYRLPDFINIERYHPLFLYESLYNLANMVFLLWLARRFDKTLKPGDVFLTYLIVYPVGRFFLEFLRLDASQVIGLNVNQTLMLVTALASAAFLFIRHRKSASVS